MKYENKGKALSLIKEIENQEEIVKRAKSVSNNLNHYSISICAVDAYNKIYISLSTQQLCDFFNRIIDDANEQIRKCKQEIEGL